MLNNKAVKESSIILYVLILVLLGCVSAFNNRIITHSTNQLSLKHLSISRAKLPSQIKLSQFNSKPKSLFQLSVENSDVEIQIDEAEENIRIAKEFARSKLGLLNPDLLDSSFIEIRQDFTTASRDKYISDLSKSRSTILRALPDYDFRPYDFTVDENDKSVVWFKLRPVGEFKGPLSYNDEVYLPTNEDVEFPVVQASISVKDGKVKFTPNLLLFHLNYYYYLIYRL